MINEVKQMRDKVRFGARELNTYAEPMPVSALKEGAVYFSLNFIDEELTVPSMEPVVFIGKDLESDATDQFYFQDAESHRQGLRYDSENADGRATFYCGAAPKHMFDYEYALNSLMLCSLRRGKSPGAAVSTSGQ